MLPIPVESSRMSLVGYHDLAGRPAFKIAAQEAGNRFYLYLSHFWHAGWSVVDVTDAEQPRLVNFAGVSSFDRTWTTQVQVAGGLMIGSLEKPYTDITGSDVTGDFDEGLLIFDVASDPENPRRLGQFKTGGTGTHRNFYAGGRFAYLCAKPAGYTGGCLLVLDISDPARPREAGRWWWPGQHHLVGEVPEYSDLQYMHGPAYAVGSRAYVSYGRAGALIMDISQPGRPQLISRLTVGDLGGTLGCHSAVPIPGRDLLVMNSEAISEGRAEGLNYALVADIADEAHPKIIGTLPVPRPDAHAPYTSYHDKGGRFGPHNQAHSQGMPVFRQLARHVVMTYFNAGVRVFDLADPCSPVEVGYYVACDPPQRRGLLPATALVTQAEDVAVDRRGYIYCTDKNWGLSVLRYDGTLD